MPDVFMDPIELRRVAERIYADRNFDFKPRLEEINGQLEGLADTRAKYQRQGDPAADGFVYGISGIGDYLDTCINENLDLLRKASQGFEAMANGLAAIAQDHVATDGEAGNDLSDTMVYFQAPIGGERNGGMTGE